MSLLLISCSDYKQKSPINSILTEKKLDIESKINFRTVSVLNETNKRIIDIASIAFTNSKQLKESQLILKIKNEHLKIESDLKEITNKNLIIVPEPIFELNLNEKFLNGINSSYYLISLLEKEINNQIKLLDSIEKTTTDKDFKNFADKSKDLLITNSELLDNFL